MILLQRAAPRSVFASSPLMGALLLCLVNLLALAQLRAVPLSMTYQGHILLSDVPYDGTGFFKFALLDGSGDSVWSNDGTSSSGSEPAAGLALPVTRGSYSIRLGDTSISGMEALPLSAFEAEALSLRIWFKAESGGYQLLAPDREFGSVAFSIRSASSDYATVAGSVTSVPNIDASKVASGTLGDGRIPASIARDAEVDTKLAAHTIDAAKVNSGTLSDARIPASIARDAEVDTKIGAATFDASKITSGTLNDSRIGSSIARVSALTAEVAALQSQIDSLRSGSGSSPGVSAVVASTVFNDAELLDLGYRRFSTVSSAGWVDGSAAGAPAGRSGHSAVWTGTDLIVWGGEIAASTFSSTGGIYDAEFDAWSGISTLDGPAARAKHGAVWTGSEMLIWGGLDGSDYLADGKRFDPKTQLWTPISATGAPSARAGHVTVWTGNKMVVWGGINGGGLLGDGGIYDPVTDTWADLSSTGAPSARTGAKAVWTGAAVVLFGGEGETGDLSNGARLNFSSGSPTSWQALSSSGAPSGRSGHSMTWTGESVLIFGGESSGIVLGDGFSYDLDANAWTALEAESGPDARSGHVGIWTGDELVIYGGQVGSGRTASSFAYDIAEGSWRSVVGGSPIAREGATSAWIDGEIIVFGGRDGSTRFASLQRIDPSPTVYLFRTP